MKPLELEGVSRETLEKLKAYHALLLKWQEKINLISSVTVSDAWNRHFIDSAQIAPLLPEGIKSIVDLGSGAGFAGLVLAMMRPDISLTLVESDAKKCAFLQTVSRETRTPVVIRNARIEAATSDIKAPDIITARALASLKSLLDYCEPWLVSRENIRFIFPKGAQFSAEIADANQAGWQFDWTETQSKTDPAARILCLTHVRR